MKLEVVPRFQINGKKYTYDELSKEKIMEIINAVNPPIHYNNQKLDLY